MNGSRRRVGVDARALLEPPGGLRRYAERVLPLLPRLAPDVDWLFYVTALPADQDAIDGGSWRVVPGSLRAALRPWWEDVRFPRALGADAAAAVLSIYGIVSRTHLPVIAVAHDLAAVTHPATLSVVHRWYWRRVARRLARATRVVAVSQFTANELIRLAGVAEDHLTVGMLAPAEVFHPAAPELVQSLATTFGLHSPYLVVVAGSGGSRKGLATVCAAIADLEVDLVVVGSAGPTAPTARVQVLGRLADGDLAALMTGALAVLCPSLTEGFGLPVVEAMACGTPVLASDAGALPEAAGGAALLLPAGDVAAWRAGIVRVMESPEERRRLGRAGRDRVSSLSWEQTATTVVEALRQALGERS